MMNCGGFHGGLDFDGPGFGGQSDCGPGGHGGFGHGGPGFRHRGKRAAIVTAALLLDGPADAAQIVARISEATDGAFAPPQEIAEMVIAKLAGRGMVTVDNGVATLTEMGRNVLAYRGITSQTAQAMVARVGKVADVIKIRTGIREIAGMARTIMFSGTEAQKATLAEVRTTLTTAVEGAKKSLHQALAQS